MKFILVILIFTAGISAQSRIDSLYNQYMALHQKGTQENLNFLTSQENVKCGFGIENGVRLGIKSFSPAQQKILKTMFMRPELDTSIVSPSGFFRIHFNTGTDAPQYDVNELAKAFDSTYSFEVNYLGFLPPPRDLGKGGDDKYDVYVYPMHGVYGNTTSEDEISHGSKTYYSYIEMDNGFEGYMYPTKGLSAAKVTAAHELHHAIQMGNYILRESSTEVLDVYFYEITSTSMEEFVFDDVNDYYYYMKDKDGYFNFTDKAFGDEFGSNYLVGYNLAIWNIFLKDKFNYTVIRRQWELMKNYRALEAIDRSLIEEQSSFLEAYKEFGLWTYHTNYRTVPGNYFNEAVNYPLIRPIMSVNFSGTSTPVHLSNYVTSTSYLKVISSLNTPKDTIYFIISNFELENGINNLKKQFPVSITLSASKQDGFTLIGKDYYYLFSAENPYLWKTSSIFDTVVVSDSQKVIAAQHPFPSPFRYGKSKWIKIPFNGNFDEEVSFQVFSISMNMVYDNNLILYRDPIKGEAVVEWNGLNNKNEKLASGVYVYFIKSQARTALGKLVIVNE